MANTKIMLGSGKDPARSTFMFLLQLKEEDNGQKRCGSGILLPKSNKKCVKAMIAAVNQAGMKKYGADFDCMDEDSDVKIPFEDGDELLLQKKHKKRKEIKGHYVINAKAYSLPDVVGRDKSEIIGKEREETLKSGNYFVFCVDFKAYNPNGGGIRAELKNMMFIKEGEALDGSLTGEEEFENYALDGDDEEYTQKDVKTLYKKALAEDKKAAKKALRATGEDDVSDIDEEDYADFVSDLKEILDEEDETGSDDVTQDDVEALASKAKKADKKATRKLLDKACDGDIDDLDEDDYADTMEALQEIIDDADDDADDDDDKKSKPKTSAKRRPRRK